MQIGDRQLVLGPLLGSGGYGEVYLANMRTPGGLESPVAVKILHHDPSGSSEPADRLRDEARLLIGIQHPAIVHALDLVWVDGRPALITEYVPGLDLEQCLHLDDPPPPRALLEIVLHVATALEAAYRGATTGPSEVVHRDIKPSNIRIGHHGEVRLLDFGIAMFSQAERHAHTRTDVVVGSAPYMAPERFVSRSSGPEVDVFGLGCCLYEGLSGRRFHDQPHLRDLTAISISAERYADHLRERLAHLAGRPPVVGDLAHRMLAFRPADRPTASEVVDRAEAIAQQIGGLTLKRWCAQLAWPETTRLSGRLSGRTIEGTGRRQTLPPEVRKLELRGPKIVREAPVTQDPAGGTPERSPDEIETVALPRSSPAPEPSRRPSPWIVAAGCLLPLGLGIAVATAVFMAMVLRIAG